MTRLLVITPDLSDNSTGRAFVWWSLARFLSWDVDVCSFAGSRLWAPLQGTEFEKACTRLPQRILATRAMKLAREAPRYDAVITIKPLTGSLAVALYARLLRRFALIVDIDDPDLEARLGQGTPLRRILWRARHFPLWRRVRNFSSINRQAAIAVSNPVLKARYGGTIVPHARDDAGPGPAHVSTSPRVAFIGTVRQHKGVQLLRDAVAGLSQTGIRLRITASPPDDAREWEEWVGEGSLATGREHLLASDLVVLPSIPSAFSEGQLPAKLVDAMMHGRVPLVSAIEPMGWAVGDPALTFAPGSIEELTAAIERMLDPNERSRFALEMQARATALFSTEAVAPLLPRLLREAQGKAER